jgi:thiol-disulfide isomerase/thioredoxin
MKKTDLFKDLSKLFLTGLFILMGHAYVHAGNGDGGYEIKVKLENYGRDTLLLGYQMGNSTYIKDTAILDKATGFFTFRGDKKLSAGVYLIVTPPDNNYFQIMVNDKEQNITLITNPATPYIKAQLKGSTDNTIFFNYMSYLNDKRKEAEDANAKRKTDSLGSLKILNNLDKEVREYQENLIKKNAGTVASALIKTASEIETPKFDDLKEKNERDMAMYLYYKQHYFDNFDMANPALLRSPVLFQRIDAYIEKLTPQHPDSICISLDRIMELVQPNKETFQYYFIHYLNQYAKSKLVGFDAIYVHLSKKYIETGITDAFIEGENRTKIVTNANKIYPILIGKKAPEIKVFREDNSQVSLHGIKSKYTVLFFFEPTCGHCQKQTPDLVAFAKKMKEKGIDIKIVPTCTFVGTEKIPECWKYIKEKGMAEDFNFIPTVDPYMISRYKTLYNVESTPQIFVLDENKIIRSKSIEAKQLEDVMDYIIKEDNDKIKNEVRGKQ